MEHIRYVKIEVEIDTNKRTVKKTFSSFEELDEWRAEYGYDPYDPVSCVVTSDDEE
jgi:hypothetical protein